MSSEKFQSIMLKIWLIVSLGSLLGVVAFIFGYVLFKGFSVLNLTFIFDKPRGIPLGSSGGIFPAIIGSLLLMITACLFASLFAIATAIYTVFYCPSKKLASLINLLTQCLAGIPSILLGLFGYAFLIVYLRVGRSLLVAGLTLAIMIFPYITVKIEKLLRELNPHIINSSYALGISKGHTISKLVLPMCRAEILSTVLLAAGFAMGATAPIILTGVTIYAPLPKSLLAPIMALPYHLYILINEGISLDNAFGTAAILIILLLIINLLSLVIIKRRRKLEWK